MEEQKIYTVECAELQVAVWVPKECSLKQQSIIKTQILDLWKAWGKENS